MMVDEIINACIHAGISLSLTEDENIDIHAEEGALTPDLISLLKNNKLDLIEWLKARERKQPAHRAKERLKLKSIGEHETYSLSFQQEGIWLTDQIDGSLQYNLPRIFELEGEVKQNKLNESLRLLAGRHPVLRANFNNGEDGQSEQSIGKVPEKILRYHNLIGQKNGEFETQIATHIKNEASKPFDLSRDLLLRVNLFERQKQSYVLLITMHHIASDAWSGGIFLRDLDSIYLSLVTEEEIPLPNLDIQYVDYANWQRKQLASGALDQELKYWRKQLEGIPDQHSLPLDRVRSNTPSFRGGTVCQKINHSLTAQLNGLASRNGVTFFMLLNAAFASFIHRYSGCDDIVIGTPVANRDEPQVQNLIGYFANVILLRSRFTGEQSFNELLQQSKHTCLDAFENQSLPFERLVNDLKPERQANRNPLFQILLTLHNIKSRELALSGIQCRPLERETLYSQVDLSLEVFENKCGLDLRWEFATDLFDKPTIENLSTYFLSFLGSVASSPELPCSKIALLSEAEKKKLLFDYNNTSTAFANEKTIHQVFEEWVERCPKNTALVFGAQSISYLELNERANRLAHYLRQLNIGVESMVGIYLDRSMEVIIAILAILKAGGAYVPFDCGYPKNRLEFMAKDCGLELMLTSRDLFEKAHTLSENLRLIELDDPHLLKQLECCPADNLPILPSQCAKNLAYVIYTSGSTGKPKGVLLEHQGAVNLAHAQQALFSVAEQSRVLQFASFSFDAATSEWMMALLKGAALIICSEEVRQSTEKVQNLLIESKVSHATLPPTYLALLDNNLEYFLESLIVAGESCDAELANLWSKKLRLINAYGPSEATVCATTQVLLPGRGVGIGKPIDNTRLYVLDSCQNLVPQGGVGELYIGGMGVARGYLNRPELTAEKFIQNPFAMQAKDRLYRSGDLVRQLTDGSFVFIGRIDDQVKIRGVRIEIGEIENQLSRIEGVKSSIVVLQRAENSSKNLVAYITRSHFTDDHIGDDVGEGNKKFTEIILRKLEENLPSFMVPRGIIVLDKFPLNANGKIDKKVLPKFDSDLDITLLQKPEGETERILAAIWSELLHCPVEKIGRDSNYFALGGDSILSIQMVSRCAKLGLKLSVKLIFENQTLCKLASVVGSRSLNSTSKEVSGSFALLPIQKRFFSDTEGLSQFCQTFNVGLPSSFDASSLPSIISELYRHHDMLRASFVQENGCWVGHYQEFKNEFTSSILCTMELDSWDERERAIIDVQRAFELDSPLFKALYLTVKDGSGSGGLSGGLSKELPGELWLLAHHLIIDGVSWRILLDDIRDLYLCFTQHKPLSLGGKTSSFKDWTEWLFHHYRSDKLNQESDYWASQVAIGSDNALGCIKEPGCIKDERTIELQCDSETTNALLTDCHRPYGTKISDLLLSGILLAHKRWSGKAELYVDMEGHGREELDSELDLSQTVGWFTILYPMQLVMHGDSIAELICGVKESIRAVPNNGIGYGISHEINCNLLQDIHTDKPGGADILFNYLGQFDRTFDRTSDSTLEGFCGELSLIGEPVSSQRRLTHGLSLNGFISEGSLKFALSYDGKMYAESDITLLAVYIKQALKDVTEHCLEESNIQLTPSDFPLCHFDQSELRKISSRLPHPNNIQQIYPATSMQQGMLYHSKIDKSAYVTQMAFALKGDINNIVLKASWQKIVDRYDSYRTHFVTSDSGKIYQVVEGDCTIQWKFEDLSHLASADRVKQIEEIRMIDKCAGFDVECSPLMHFRLWKTGVHEFKLIWTQHHALSDGWCLPIVLQDLQQYYCSISTGKRLELEPVYPYGHYIKWLQNKDDASSTEYWRKNLSELERKTNICRRNGLKNTLPENEPQAMHRLNFSLSVEESRALTTLVQGHQTTLNILIQALWSYLISIYGREDVVVFATTVSGRPANVEGIERMVGLFINSIPVCIDMSKARLYSLGDLLRYLHSEQVEREEHSHIPLTEIVKNCSGLMDVPESLLVVENYPFKKQENSEFQLDILESYEETSFDLTLTVAQRETLSFRLEGKRTKYTALLIEQLKSSLLNLIAQVCSNPACDVSALSLVNHSEKDRLIQAQNKKEYLANSQELIHVLFEKRALLEPDQTAISLGATYSRRRHSGIKHYSYSQVNSRANKLAFHLRSKGIAPGSLVGMYLERSVESIISILAVLKSGAAYMPLDVDCPEDRLKYIVETSGVAAILAFSKDEKFLRSHTACDKLLLLDAENFSDTLSTYSDENPDCLLKGDTTNTAYVIYTSGSTGQPKGVAQTHRTIVNLVESTAIKDGITGSLRTLQFTPLTFDVSIQELATCWFTGSPLILMSQAEKDNINGFSHVLQQHAIERCFMPPAVLQYLSERQISLPDLKEVIVAGEAFFMSSSIRKFMDNHSGCKLFNHYGPTETHVATTMEVTNSEENSWPPIGESVQNAKLFVLDQNGQLAPYGCIGELYVGGALLAQGYWNNTNLTHERFVDIPLTNVGTIKLYRTGDLVRYISQGVLEYMGRTDNQIKIRGFRIELEEIEVQLAACNNVGSAVVIAKETGDGQKSLIAFVVNRKPCSNELNYFDKLKMELAKKLPAYMIPSNFALIKNIPLTHNGKVDRRALANSDIKYACNNQQCLTSKTELALAGIWAEILGVDIEKLFKESHFMDLGGHSLLIARLQASISSNFAMEIDIATLFEVPSLESLAALIDSHALQNKIQLEYASKGSELLEEMEF